MCLNIKKINTFDKELKHRPFFMCLDVEKINTDFILSFCSPFISFCFLNTQF